MSTGKTRPLRVSTAVKWRRAFVAFLIVATGFAPVANAACDLAHLAGHLRSHDATLATWMADPSPSVPDDEDGSCCGRASEALVSEAKLPVADGALAPLVTGAYALAVNRSPGVKVEFCDPVIIRQHALAPPEPAFRRVPRLLL